MAWDRMAAAEALVGKLAGIDPSVAVFGSPPQTFNPPAYIVGYPRRVNRNTVSFGVDETEQPILAAGGASEIDRVADLLTLAGEAFDADPSLGGAVMLCIANPQENWRMLNVAGADILVADLTLQIRM